MAEWNKNKVEPSAINNGQEFKLKDNLAIDELNAIVNNSFYASDTAKRAEELAQSAITGNGTLVTINEEIQGTWSADFAESERQKSKNLLVYPYSTTHNASYGITFKDNGDGGFIIKGQQTNTQYNSTRHLHYTLKVKAGTYTFGLFGDTQNTGVGFIVYDGVTYRKAEVGQTTTFTATTDASLEIYLQVVKTSTFNFNNMIVYPMLVSGTELGDYQPYNGAIVHEKDIADVEHIEVLYDKDISDKNTIGGVAYANGVGADLVSDTTLSGGTVSITSNYSFEKYNKVIAIFEAGAGNGRFEVQLHKISPNTLTGTSAGYPVNISASRMFFVYVRFNNGAISFKPRSIVNGSSEISVFNSEYFKLIKFYGVY